jgi:hypothetical protein
MFLATINKPKQFIYFEYIGHVTAMDFRHGAADLDALLGELAPGFRVLADLSRVESFDIACVAEIGKTMEKLERSQVGLIVRVIPDEGKDIGFNIIAAFHYKTRPQSATFETIQEAGKLLGL